MGGIIAILLIGGLFWWAVVSGKEQERREKEERILKENKKRLEEYKQPFKNIYYGVPSKVKELKQKAQSGDADAQGELAAIYLYGAEDKDLAMHWYRKAAENGNEKAIKFLADEQRFQQQWDLWGRQFDEDQKRRQFVNDVNRLREGKKLHY
ncbi:MAG: SEL1-like repeat protein [Synergistaceae bacterium]|nr:SEL1-like repeat protein [Synergistaceae bacterium]